MSKFRLTQIVIMLTATLALGSLASCGAAGNGGNVVIPPFNMYWSVAVADLNGGGRLDIVASYSKIAGPPPHPGVVAIFFQDAANPGNFLPPVNYDVGNDPVALAIGDLNGDGNLDIATANTIMNVDGTGSSSVSVLLQDSGNPGRFLSAVNYPTGFSPVAVAIGDLDGDGRPDLAVADTTGISLLMQNPAAPGTFLAASTISVGNGGTSAVAIADLNGDGKADLVATASGVSVYLQDPHSPGHLLSPASYAVGAQPIFIAVQDLDGDSRTDLAIANLGTPEDGSTASLSVLLQSTSGAGVFLPATNYSTGIRSSVVVAADLNGDGKTDIVVSNSGDLSGSSVSVFLQDPLAPGTFQPATNYAGSGVVCWVAVGDMNGDNKPDLVIVDSGIVIRMQDPATPGQFLPPVVIASQ
jgi:FG-GAP-like repeat/FG-GAP repeat